jgi:hypothetical protein
VSGLLLTLRTGPGQMDMAADFLLEVFAVRFLMTVNGGGRPPDKELFAEMGRFVEELTRGPRAAWTAARTSAPPAGTSRSPTGRSPSPRR